MVGANHKVLAENVEDEKQAVAGIRNDKIGKDGVGVNCGRLNLCLVFIFAVKGMEVDNGFDDSLRTSCRIYWGTGSSDNWS